MTPQQIELVQTSWKQVEPIAETAAGLFYDRLFEIDPAMTDLFGRAPMDSQRVKLVRALDRVVTGLPDFEAMRPDLKALGRRHLAYGVGETHYATVGTALIWTLERGLADIWTIRFRDAWTAAYTAISAAMREGAREAITRNQSSDWPGFVPGWRPSYNKFWL